MLKKRFKSFPWGSLGRPETSAELFHKWDQQRAAVRFLAERPLLSLILIDDGTASDSAVTDSLAALSLQSYPHWEAVVVTRGRRPLDGEWRNAIRWIDVGTNQRSEMRNLGAAQAQGDWLGFIDAGDVLSPVALFLIVAEIAREPIADVIYTHEAAIDAAAKQISAYFSKAAHSWFNLLHFNAVGKFWLVRGSWWGRLGGFRPEAGAHSEHDFLLRATELHAHFHLLPFFLYYRRGDKGITPADATLVRLIQASLQRRGIPATVDLAEGLHPSLDVRPVFADPESALVSAIICFRDRAEWTITSVERLVRFAGLVPIEIFLVNNGSSDESLKRVREFLPSIKVPIKIVDYPGPFNFAQMHNLIVRDHARGNYLLTLNNDVFWEKGGVDELVAWAQFPWVGTVGMCLRHGHGDLQHGGLRAFFGGPARLARIGHEVTESDLARQNREVFGNTFAASLFKRETFDKIGGLRALDLPNGFGDVAFNFECIRQGLKNIFLGHVEGVHLESASRGTSYEYWEEVIVEREYPEILQRMLREDLGYSRVPASDLSISDFTRTWATVKVREKLPWLKPIKVGLKKVWRDLGLRGEGRTT